MATIEEKMLEEAVSATPNYSIDYEDEKFKNVDDSIARQENEYNQIYGGMIDSTDKFYNDLKDSTQQWADKQSQIQQENTDFAIEKIEQEKAQANKDYQKEQSGAYVDWRKQSNQYGTEAEKMASAGLSNTGYSESSQVSMYNTYQNRVATARESYNRAVLNYDNMIKDAQLQNNAALAEIAFTTLQKQLELSLEGFQNKNQLVIEQANKKAELENIKWNRYQDILQQMNTENALKEDIRQYNETQKWQTEQAELDRQHQLKRDEIQREFETKQAELDRKHDFALLEAKTAAEKKAAEEQHKRDMEKLKKEQEYKLAQLDKQLANDKALLNYQKSLSSSSITGGSSGGSSGSKTGSTSNKTSITGNKTNKSTTNSKIAAAFGTQAVDMDNILSLGFGPISAAELDRLVREGKVIEYKENGVIKFKKAPNQTTTQKVAGPQRNYGGIRDNPNTATPAPTLVKPFQWMK